MDRLLTEGTFLAVRSLDDFCLCRLDESVTIEPDKSYDVTMLKQKNLKEDYIISSKAKINAENIICSVKMQKISRFTFKLPDAGRIFVENELKYVLEELSENNFQNKDNGEQCEFKTNNTITNDTSMDNEDGRSQTELEYQESIETFSLEYNGDIAIKKCNVSMQEKEMEKFSQLKDISTQNYIKEDSDKISNTSAEELYEDSGSECSPDVDTKKKYQKWRFKKNIQKIQNKSKPEKTEKVNQKKDNSLGHNKFFTPQNKNKKIIILENITVKASNVTENVAQNLDAANTNFVKKRDVETSSSSDDEIPQVIRISKAKKNNNKRIYDKQHSCFICHKKCLKMSRHLELQHNEDTNIAKVLAMEKNSTERRNGFLHLIRAGDFYHNMEVLAQKQGELILCRRPGERECAEKYSFKKFGPCPYCLGFLLKKQLWAHAKKCCLVMCDDKDTALKSSIQMESNSIVSSILHSDLSKEFRKFIIDSLQNDGISYACKTDRVILGVGAMAFEKHGCSQNDLIRQTMRQLGRLLIELRESQTESHAKGLDYFINPIYFDIIILAVKSLCKTKTYDLKRSEYGIPSLALKIGHSLRKCVGYLRGQSLRIGDINNDQKYKSFLELLDLEWSTRISSSALATMEMRKMNSANLLPMTSDLLKLNNFISNEIKIFLVLLDNNRSEKDAWLKLAEATLARVILFNKRRSGEASRMTLTQYKSYPNWTAESTEELQNSLSQFEKEIANKMKLIQIRGKRGRTVPVLLTNEMVSAINLLISTRCNVGVAQENEFVFARVNNESLGYIRGPDALRRIVLKADVQYPDQITSTKLRKYIATVSQVFSLKDNELDWLARHLGHDIRVHRDFYRLHESAVELTKVSRILMTVDEGKVAQFKGKDLSDINLTELPEIEEDNGSDNESDEECDTAVTCVPKIRNKENRFQAARSAKSVDLPDESTKLIKVKKVPWNTEEVKAVTTFFRSSIKKKIVPGKKLCEECIEANRNALERRTWKDIKYYVKNHIDKISKCKNC